MQLAVSWHCISTYADSAQLQKWKPLVKVCWFIKKKDLLIGKEKQECGKKKICSSDCFRIVGIKWLNNSNWNNSEDSTVLKSETRDWVEIVPYIPHHQWEDAQSWWPSYIDVDMWESKFSLSWKEKAPPYPTLLQSLSRIRSSTQGSKSLGLGWLLL